VTSDEIAQKSYLIIYEKDGNFKAQILFKNSLHEVTEFEGLTSDTNILTVQFDSPDKYLLIQTGKHLKLYKFGYTEHAHEEKKEEGEGEGGDDDGEEAKSGDENKEGEQEDGNEDVGEQEEDEEDDDDDQKRKKKAKSGKIE
jgi:hypothetical protein